MQTSSNPRWSTPVQGSTFINFLQCMARRVPSPASILCFDNLKTYILLFFCSKSKTAVSSQWERLVLPPDSRPLNLSSAWGRRTLATIESHMWGALWSRVSRLRLQDASFVETRGWSAPGSHGTMQLACLNNFTGWQETETLHSGIIRNYVWSPGWGTSSDWSTLFWEAEWKGNLWLGYSWLSWFYHM